MGQRNGNFDVGSIATWINCFLATGRVDRSMKLIERIPSAANFFLQLRRVALTKRVNLLFMLVKLLARRLRKIDMYFDLFIYYLYPISFIRTFLSFLV